MDFSPALQIFNKKWWNVGRKCYCLHDTDINYMLWQHSMKMYRFYFLIKTDLGKNMIYKIWNFWLRAHKCLIAQLLIKTDSCQLASQCKEFTKKVKGGGKLFDRATGN